jgi:hypothetical protein
MDTTLDPIEHRRIDDDGTMAPVCTINGDGTVTWHEDAGPDDLERQIPHYPEASRAIAMLIVTSERNRTAAEIRIRDLEAEVRRLREVAPDTLANLVAATSLLECGGKKAAPSDKIFALMLKDYGAAIERARAALAQDAAHPSPEEAPGHTDLMVSPESIDAFLEANPLPAAEETAEAVCLECNNTREVRFGWMGQWWKPCPRCGGREGTP